MKKIKNVRLTKHLFFSLSLLPFVAFGQNFLPVNLHSTVDRVQPMTGIVFWADNTSDLRTLGNKTQLEFAYLVYSDVIEQANTYNWTSVDNLLSTAASRGRQVILRFRDTYPGVTKRSVPLYVTQAADYTPHSLVKVEGSNTYIPNWNSTTWQNFVLEFYTKFAERYDNDPRLAFVQVGFGSYAEYHLYDGPSNPLTSGYFPSKNYQTTFLNHVNNEFENTQWSLSIDAASSSYSPIAASTALINLNYGLFDDSFLHENHSENNSEYNRASWLKFGANRADSRAAGGELNYYSDYDQQNVLKPLTGPWGTSYETLSAMYKITYMIGNDQLNYQSATRIQEAGMANGYHYEVTSYETNGISTNITIKNTGIAPIYYDAYPTINGISSTSSLKGLLAGQSREFSIDAVAEGEDLSIQCSRTVAGQVIQFDAAIDAVISSTEEYQNSNVGYAFPSMFQNQLYISNQLNADLNVTILNSRGEIMYETLIHSDISIETEGFSAGIYFVKITNGENMKTIKVVKK